ncbi:MAG: dTDP-4-dehydrorhamnose 3,5-epimerase [Desulfobacterales bacterium]|nr:dTDP-4-dehydrorhamnose 3,5-epimerase [Desulfobacterales bacterium]
MEIQATPIDGVWVLTPRVFSDPRGFFMETFQRERFAAAGLPSDFVQDNLSFSSRNTLRGLHFQTPRAQAKHVQVIQGEIFDVAVDIRLGSPTFGQWFGIKLSSANNQQMLIAAGLAHGFCVTSETAHVLYKCTDFYAPEAEGGVLWSDPDIGIDWPVENPLLSEKDRQYPRLKALPREMLTGGK